MTLLCASTSSQKKIVAPEVNRLASQVGVSSNTMTTLKLIAMASVSRYGTSVSDQRASLATAGEHKERR
jgi:hypothetical protein